MGACVRGRLLAKIYPILSPPLPHPLPSILLSHPHISLGQAVFGKDPREYSVMTKEFLKDDKGHVKGLVTVAVEVTAQGIKPVPGSEKVRSI